NSSFPSGNLFCGSVSNALRTRATSHPCERGAGLLVDKSDPGRLAPQISAATFGPPSQPQILAEKLWRCVMPLQPRAVSVPEVVHEERLGSLRSCLVEGDAEQRHRERRVRRRALISSILIQTAVLALLILLPLFGKSERIALAKNYIPIPPYGR